MFFPLWSDEYSLGAKISTVSESSYFVDDPGNYFQIILNVNSPAAAVTVTIASAMLERRTKITVKDIGGNAFYYPITITCEGSETIDGNSTKTISLGWTSLTFYNDKNNWFVE